MLQWLGRDVHPLNVTACEYAPLPLPLPLPLPPLPLPPLTFPPLPLPLPLPLAPPLPLPLHGWGETSTLSTSPLASTPLNPKLLLLYYSRA